MSEVYEIVPKNTTQSACNAAVNRGIPSEHEIFVYQTMAEQAVSSKMYRGIGEKAGVMMIMLAARELNIPPMQALNGGLNIINGKVEISARMMSALIRKAGHQIRIDESTETSCTLTGCRSDTRESAQVTFTIAEANKAGLIKSGGGWTKWPKDMLFARALSRLARQLFSDVIGMGYVEGEISVQETPRIESCEPVVVENEDDETDQLQKYLEIFMESEHEVAMNYLTAVQNNFGWSQEIALKNLLLKPNLVEMVREWNEKRKK